MYYELFLIVIGFIWICFASLQDLKHREVANWLSFSLIAFAIGFRFFYSLFKENFGLFYQGLIWLGIFLILGNLFYYARIFAGGDAKLLIALGTILPLSPYFYENLKIVSYFFLIFFIAGSFYGLIWSFGLTLKNFKKFRKEFTYQLRKNRLFFRLGIFLGLLIILLGFFNSLFIFLGIIVFIFPYFFIYSKTVDEACMIKKIPSSQLREGDWIYKDMKVSGKTVKTNWEGVSSDDIKLIKKKYRFVEIREGIPFIPVFFISFLILVILWYSSWKPYFFFF